MRLLFAITVCSFCAVMWVALALARRIRRSQISPLKTAIRSASRGVDSRRPATQEFFEAGEFRTPRPLRLDQEILQRKPRRALGEIAFASETIAAAAIIPVGERPLPILDSPQLTIQKAHTPESIPIRSATPHASLFGRTVPIARIDHHLHTAALGTSKLSKDAVLTQPASGSIPVPISLHRKPPQTSRQSGLRRRIDLSHFNKDMGDLTDPYTHPLRGSGTQGPVPADRAKC